MSGQDSGQEAFVSFGGLPVRHAGLVVMVGVTSGYCFVVSCRSGVVVRLKQGWIVRLG